MAAPTVPVSDEDLQAAWARLRHRAWPATLAETLQDPARESLLLGMARRIAYQRRYPAAPARQPTRCAPRVAPLHSPPPGWVDHKRAAAGDRDDD